jgi:hypothetical protein
VTNYDDAFQIVIRVVLKICEKSVERLMVDSNRFRRGNRPFFRGPPKAGEHDGYGKSHGPATAKVDALLLIWPMLAVARPQYPGLRFGRAVSRQEAGNPHQVGADALRFYSELVVDGVAQLLFTAQVAFSRLNGHVAK